MGATAAGAVIVMIATAAVALKNLSPLPRLVIDRTITTTNEAVARIFRRSAAETAEKENNWSVQ